MSHFLEEIIEGKKFTLLIDTKIFPKDIILKAAYNHLDSGYFFFKFDINQNIILEFSTKEGIDTSPKKIIGKFSDEILDVYLRDKIEKDNKVIREAIYLKAINGPLDMKNFVSLDTDTQNNKEIDFDKDIDEILREIENDPDMQIDTNEIEKILQEIENDTKLEGDKPTFLVDKSSILNAKDIFKKK